MGFQIGRWIDRARHTRLVSLVVRLFASPLVRFLDTMSEQTRRKVKVNGGSAVVEGIRLTFPKDVGTLYLSALYWRGGSALESDIWWVLKALIPTSRRFADVGSYVGFYSVLAKKLNPGCDVWAIEPVPAIAEKNSRFLKANQVNVRLLQVALSDQDGVGTLYLPRSETNVEETTATLQTDSWQQRGAARGEATPHSVRTVKLDTLCEKSEWWPDVVKIDVEDHEAAVLRGMERLMRKERPYVICEILPRDHGNQKTLSAVRSFDYDLFAITPSGLFRVTDLPRARTYSDCLLAPAEPANGTETHPSRV